MGFLSTTGVGRLVPVPPEEDAQSELSEWELRERNEREEARSREAEELDAEVEVPRPPSWPLRKRSRETTVFRPFFLFFPLTFPGRAPPFSGRAWEEGKGEL